MKSPSWRSALLAGCLLVGGMLQPALADSSAQVETAETTNLPRHVSIRDSHGHAFAQLSYAEDAYEYYRVTSSSGDGQLRSDRSHQFRLTGPEAWSLSGNGKGFTLFNGDGQAIYRIERWGGKIGDASGPSSDARGTQQGVYGDWKILDMHRHPLYFLESLDHNYNVLDKHFHILSAIKPNNKGGYVVMDKGNKTWWTVSGHNLTPLTASFMAVGGVSPWARILMGAYFLPDWW